MAEPEPERVVDAAAFIHDAPFEVLNALLCRLSPKWILRMRAVCKPWGDMLNQWAAWGRSLAPPQPLLCFDRVVCPDRDIRLKDYCIESLDLSSDRLRHVLRFTDSEFYESPVAVRVRDDAPHIDAAHVDYRKMEKENYVDGFKQLLLVHASLNGYLLVSFSFGWYVINPATRHWVSLPTLTPWNVIGFYEHFFSGEYRVLCSGKRVEEGAPTQWYHVVSVSRPVQWRSIGRPISSDTPMDLGLGTGLEIACISPPIQLRYNRHLHWPPQESQGYHILVFDTWNEKFSWKRPPPVRDEDMRLLEFPDGDLGLSVSRQNRETLELWRLEDYQNEVWVPVYQVQLALHQMPVLQDEGVWIPAVVSPEGDVLIQSARWLLHCDRNGTLLRKFGLPNVPMRVLPIRHVLRESLLQHQMFLAPNVAGGSPEPSFFRWPCSDPSW